MLRALVSTLASIVALAPLAAAPLAAQEVCDIPVVASDPLGPADLVARDGAYLFVVAGRALLIYGLSDPEHPNQIGRLDFDVDVGDIDVAGSLLAAAAGEKGVLLIDVSVPTQPLERARFDTSWIVGDVDVRGSLVYVARTIGPGAQARGALMILDASDPADPVLLGSRLFPVGVGVENVVVRGQTAFVVTDEFWSRLQVFDVSDPASPSLLGETDLFPGWHQLRVNADGTVAYALTVNQGYNGGSWVTVLDTSDRTSPVALTTFGYGFDDDADVRSILVGGDRLYVAGGASSDDKLWVYDVSSPAAPTMSGEVVLPSLTWGLAGLARRGPTLYATGAESGTLILDVAQPSAPELLGRVPTSGPIGALSLRDRVAALRTPDELRLVDLGGPGSPTPLSTTPTVQIPFDEFSNREILAQDAGLALVADRSGLQIFDISDPGAPVSRAVLAIGGSSGPSCATLRGEIAYVGVGTPPRLRVLDLSDPGAPSVIGSWNPPNGGTACPLAADGDLLLVGSPCTILGVTDPGTPDPLGSCPSRVAGQLTVLEGSTAYFGSYSALLIYDLTDPAHPVSAGGWPIGVAGFDVESSRAYVARAWLQPNERPEIRVYDVRDPAQIRLAGVGALPLWGSALAVEKGRILVGHGSLGYSVLADCPFFADGFESGDTSGWTATQP